jgi:hypothetical protein
MIRIIKKIFRYFEDLWLGNDHKISLRSSGAMALIIDFIINVHNSASIVVRVLNLILKDKHLDAALVAAMGTNLAQIAIILGVEAALIAALLGLKTYQNSMLANQPPCPETTTEEGA